MSCIAPFAIVVVLIAIYKENLRIGGDPSWKMHTGGCYTSEVFRKIGKLRFGVDFPVMDTIVDRDKGIIRVECSANRPWHMVIDDGSLDWGQIDMLWKLGEQRCQNASQQPFLKTYEFGYASGLTKGVTCVPMCDGSQCIERALIRSDRADVFIDRFGIISSSLKSDHNHKEQGAEGANVEISLAVIVLVTLFCFILSSYFKWVTRRHKDNLPH